LEGATVVADGDPSISEEGLLRQGEVLGEKYEIIREIGRGGMGAVYEARHAFLGTKLAIKKLYGAAAASRNLNERLKIEGKTASMIGHKAFVTSIDIGSHHGHTYLVMEFLEGQSLAQFMRDLGSPMPLDQVVSIVSAVGEAMQAAHDRGVIHRDLKPDNIFLTSIQGIRVVHILDCGIAKILNDAPKSMQTATGALMGTPLFMAAEQCMSSKLVVFASDTYSLAVITYYLLTGRYPFYSENQGELMAMQIRDQPPSILSVAPHLPPRVADEIHRALAKRPEDRHPTILAYANAFAAAARGEPPPVEALRASDPDRTLRGHLVPAALSPPPAATPADSTWPESARRPTTPMGVPVVQAPFSNSGPNSSLVRGEVSQPHVMPSASRSRGGIFAALSLLTLFVAGGGGAAYHFGLFGKSPAAHSSLGSPLTSLETKRSVSEDAVTEIKAAPVESKAPTPTTPKVERFRVWLDVEPKDARVSVNGVERTDPPPILLDGVSGTALNMEVRKDGYQPWKKALTIADHDERVSAKLEPEHGSGKISKADSSSAVGTLAIDVEPWGLVSIDGSKGKDSPIAVKLRAGSHRLVVENPALKKRKEMKVVVQPQKVNKMIINLNQSD
jgi:serine/threonine protein kinase